MGVNLSSEFPQFIRTIINLSTSSSSLNFNLSYVSKSSVRFMRTVIKWQIEMKNGKSIYYRYYLCQSMYFFPVRGTLSAFFLTHTYRQNDCNFQINRHFKFFVTGEYHNLLSYMLQHWFLTIEQCSNHWHALRDNQSYAEINCLSRTISSSSSYPRTLSLITSSSFFAFLKFALFVENGVFIT